MRKIVCRKQQAESAHANSFRGETVPLQRLPQIICTKQQPGRAPAHTLWRKAVPLRPVREVLFPTRPAQGASVGGALRPKTDVSLRLLRQVISDGQPVEETREGARQRTVVPLLYLQRVLYKGRVGATFKDTC